MRRELTKIAIRAVVIVAMSAGLALMVNALSPRGIPLRPMILAGDYPPPKGQPLGSKQITLDIMQGASLLAQQPIQGAAASVIIDARPPEEFGKAHIPGAINVPIEVFREGRPAQLKAIPRDANIIVYCADPECGASVTVAEQLRLYGYAPDKVGVFTPGFPGWEEAGLEVAHD
ncbi:MAG: rhodanese-like domain-containing protein [Candidatus Sumerlaeota bacterium]|nr:rhodanese-like domain-containing protein [Candidatus Sumerlaeota bacterium]